MTSGLKAEAYLVEQAADLGPRELAPGPGPAGRLAPEIADEADYQRLLAAERRAECRHPALDAAAAETDPPTSMPASPTTPPAGSAPTSTPSPHRGADHLHTSDRGPRPRTAADDEFANLPIARQRGDRVRRLPGEHPRQRPAPAWRQGHRVSIVILDHDTLRRPRPAGIAITSTGDRITVGQGPPAGLPGRDPPRRARRHSPRSSTWAARRGCSPTPSTQGPEPARPDCTTVGCTMPAEFCEAHHKVPWSQGRQHRPPRRQTALPLPPPPRPRPRLDHPPPAQRQDHLHQTDVTRLRRPTFGWSRAATEPAGISWPT